MWCGKTSKRFTNRKQPNPGPMAGELAQLARTRAQLLTAMRDVEARAVSIWMDEHPSAFDGWPSCALYDSEAHGVWLRALRGRLPNWLARSVSDHRLWAAVASHVGTLRNRNRLGYVRRVAASEGEARELPRARGGLT